jgi:DNA topoisomerase IB
MYGDSINLPPVYCKVYICLESGIKRSLHL